MGRQFGDFFADGGRIPAALQVGLNDGQGGHGWVFHGVNPVN
jgi:hypothetical protein